MRLLGDFTAGGRMENKTMEYEISTTEIFCPEPPLLSAARKSFSSVCVLLSAIFGIISAVSVPAFFGIKAPTDFGNFIKSNTFVYAMIFAVLILSYISLIAIYHGTKDVYLPLSANIFTLPQIFLPLSQLGLAAFWLGFFRGYKFNSIPNGADMAVAVFGILSALIVFISLGAIKSTVRNNIPRSGIFALGAMLFPISEILLAVPVIFASFSPSEFSKLSGAEYKLSGGRFPYAEYIGSAAAAIFLFASAVLLICVFAGYLKNQSAVKKKYGKVR